MELDKKNYWVTREYHKLRAKDLAPEIGVYRGHTLVIYSQASKNIFGAIGNIVKSAFYHLLMLFKLFSTNETKIHELMNASKKFMFKIVNEEMFDQITSLKLEKQKLETNVEKENQKLIALKKESKQLDIVLNWLKQCCEEKAKQLDFVDSALKLDFGYNSQG